MYKMLCNSFYKGKLTVGNVFWMKKETNDDLYILVFRSFLCSYGNYSV